MSLIHLMSSVFDHTSPTASALASPSAAQQSTGGVGSADDTATTSSSAPAGTITASDFLTLLVTELKNQDPTSDQDPNAYITQLVGVNSLQQLISINQELGSAVSASTTSATASESGSDSKNAVASVTDKDAINSGSTAPDPSSKRTLPSLPAIASSKNALAP